MTRQPYRLRVARQCIPEWHQARRDALWQAWRKDQGRIGSQSLSLLWRGHGVPGNILFFGLTTEPAPCCTGTVDKGGW